MTSSDQNQAPSAERPIKQACVLVAVFLSAVVPADAQRSIGPVELTLRPAKASAKAQQLRLLPTAEELLDTDAVPLYQQAIQALPDEYPRGKFGEWRAMQPDELPAAEVKSELEKLKPVLDLVNQAARSRKCNWPTIAPDKVNKQHMDDLNKFREIAFILDVQNKIQIAEGQYEQAVETLTTMLSMAKQMGNGSTLIQGMTGLNIGGLSLKKVEQIVQSADSPSLYWALQDLKFPLVDLTKTMEAEMANIENYNLILRRQFRKQLEPAHNKIRIQMDYLDRTAAALEAVEALRLHAGVHEGKFPDNLSDITEFSIPNDPVTNKPLAYSRTGSEAVIELQGTEGSEGRNAIKYVLTIEE